MSEIRPFTSLLDWQPDKGRAPSQIEFLLKRTEASNRRAGFLAWDPERIAHDPVGDPGRNFPRLTPPTPKSPRLFISYAWSTDAPFDPYVQTYEEDSWVDAFAGTLFSRGYDIVYDRDPRNLEKGLKSTDLLIRMNDCNYFVPIISNAYLERISSPQPIGAVVAEWSHARQLFPKMLTFIGIWHSGSALPEPLSQANTVDVRQYTAPWGKPIEQMFPDPIPGERGVPSLPAPVRPPDPPHWPKYQPY